MHLSVKNAKNPDLVKWLKIAAQFYAKELMHPNLIRRLSLKIEISDKLAVLGMCDWDDDFGERIRNFHVMIKRQKRVPLMIKSLAHEFVHIKQYATGEMNGIIGAYKNHKEFEVTRWAGPQVKFASNKKPISIDKNKVMIHRRGYDYYYHPWEIEAYGLEVGLYDFFTKTYGEPYREFKKQYGSISRSANIS
jgi:hypothetical protein